MKKSSFKVCLALCLRFLVSLVSSAIVDPDGYLAYCPCMGRFGNQADHFLGALGFAHELNRTLILPPWVEYRKGEVKSIQVPFDTYFKVEPLLQYHKVITMEKFMAELAPTVWPTEKRLSMCYAERVGLDGSSGKGCNAKDGNPFGPFWDTFDIDFVDSQFYGPKLHYDIHNFENTGKDWNEKFPAADWPVLAFTGAPAIFPVQDENRGLQQFLKRSNKLESKAADFIKNVLPKGAFIGIHLRNGIDWVRACEHVKGLQNLFSSAQCLGYRNEKGPLTQDICMPPKELIIRKLKRLIKKVKTINKTNPIKSIFVASDNNHMMDEFTDSLKRLDVKVYKLPNNDPQLDLAILSKSNYFIGNCVSSYSSFVKRERDVKGFPSSFWGFPIEKQERNAAKHEEL